MTEPQAERVSLSSSDVTDERLQQLKSLYPEAFTEDCIDLDRLSSALGDVAEPQRERYGLSWAGKAEAIKAIQSRSVGTLKPDRDRSVNFDTTNHLFIEGDNLEVLKLLQRSYYARVKMIYIDPPYNTGKEFIYPDKYAEGLRDYLEFSKQVGEGGVRLGANADTSGRYHSKWLTMMYPRLFLGRQLLREDGFFVVSIDDAEQHDLRLMLNEVFGEENFIATLVWDRNRKNDAKFFSVGHEYMLVYAKNKAFLTDNNVILRADKEGVDEVRVEFDRLRAEHKEDWSAIKKGLREFYSGIDEDDPRFPVTRFTKVDTKGPYRDDRDISWPGSGGPTYEVLHPITGRPVKVPSRGWIYPTKARFDEEFAKGRIVFGSDESTVPGIRTNLFDQTSQVMRSVNYSYAQVASRRFDEIFGGKRVFDNPKHFEDLAKLTEYLTDDDDLILDYFAGSASYRVVRVAHESDSNFRQL
jgi:adenine-specific DNA-methyltransferase